MAVLNASCAGIAGMASGSSGFLSASTHTEAQDADGITGRKFVLYDDEDAESPGYASRHYAGVNDGLSLNLNTADILWVVPFVPVAADSDADPIMDARNADNSASKLALWSKAGFKYQLTRASWAAFIGDETPALTPGSLYWFVVSGGTGASAAWSFKVYDADLNLIHDDSGTANLGTTNYGRLSIGRTNQFNEGRIAYYYGDLIITDGEDIAPGYVAKHRDLAATLTDDWTASVLEEDPVNLLNNLPHDDATFVASVSEGDAEAFTLESCASAGIAPGDDGIVAVRTFWSGRGVGEEGELTLVETVGETEYESGAHPVPLFIEGFSWVRGANPNTDAAWDTAALDTMTLGFVNASGTQMRMHDGQQWVLYYPAEEEEPEAGPGGGSFRARALGRGRGR